MKIDHVQLAMPRGGEKAARRFFGDLLGMDEEEKPEPLRSRGGCWFRGSECVIHVGVDPEFRPQKKAHPAFVVSDLGALEGRLEERGFSVRWDTALAGVERFYTEDPFGNRLEFIQGGREPSRRSDPSPPKEK